MATRNPATTGAVVLLLTVVPALAGHSTRAEQAATRQLNLQAAQQAQTNNQARNPQLAVTDAAANAPANTPPAAAPTQRIQTAAAAPVTNAPATDPAVMLSSVSNPPSKIATANVRDSGGEIVGAVQKVEVSAGGNPTLVSVALLGPQQKIVVLDAGALRYDPEKNELTAQASAGQIRAMSKT